MLLDLNSYLVYLIVSTSELSTKNSQTFISGSEVAVDSGYLLLLSLVLDFQITLFFIGFVVGLLVFLQVVFLLFKVILLALFLLLFILKLILTIVNLILYVGNGFNDSLASLPELLYCSLASVDGSYYCLNFLAVFCHCFYDFTNFFDKVGNSSLMFGYFGLVCNYLRSCSCRLCGFSSNLSS
jgi:hypothetical protein